MKLVQFPKNTNKKYSSSDTTQKSFTVYLNNGSELTVRAVSWLIGDYGKICFYMQSPEEIARMGMKGQEPIAVYAIRRSMVDSVAEEGAVTVVKRRQVRKKPKKTTTRKVKR